MGRNGVVSIAFACQLRVIRDRGRVSSKSGYVRSAPKATELLHRHEMTRWAMNELVRCNKFAEIYWRKT
jgi:hypothetical protein